MSDFFALRRWLQYYLPLTLLLFLSVTIERTVVTDGGYDRLYGLPLAFISNSIGYSFHYEVYVGPLLLNLACWLALVLGACWALGRRRQLPVHWAGARLGALACVVVVGLLAFAWHDSTFAWLNQTQPLEITSRRLSWGP